MTPDLVIYRYLELTSGGAVAFDELARLIATDADLLGRWLRLLQLPASPERLQEGLEHLRDDEFTGLAQAQVTSVAGYPGSARLSFDQWRSVLDTVHLASVLVETLTEELAPPALELRVLLALSGVQVPSDPLLEELIEFRGTRAELLEDAPLEMRVFAVVDAVEFNREAELGALLLGLSAAQMAECAATARQRTHLKLVALGLIDEEQPDARDVDWSQKVWLRQQVAYACMGLDEATSWDSFCAIHNRVSRTVFSKAPLLLKTDADETHLYLLDSSAQRSVSIKIASQSSLIAQAFRAMQPLTLLLGRDLPVADRQVLQALQVEEALAWPLGQGEEACVMIIAADEDVDLHAAAEIYGSQLVKYVRRINKSIKAVAGPELEQSDPAAARVEAFRQREIQRLREVVHEANNPLSIVHNYLHILELRLAHEPEAVEQLSLIDSELARAGKVFASAREVPDVVAGSLLQSEQSDTISDLDLGSFLIEVAEIHRGLALERQADLSCDPVQPSVALHCNESMLRQIVGNLLKNALEAVGPSDTVKLSGRAGLIRHGERGAEISVTDSGPGIPDTVLDNLLIAKQSSKGEGHEGLGLSVAFRLASEMGGALDVVTHPDEGTRFALFLPLRARSAD